jgi:hypothetical protein
MKTKTTYKPNRGAQRRILKSLSKTMSKAGAVARGLVRERVASKGMTDEELAQKGHPYARRHGTIKKINKSPTQYIGRQSGGILKSLRGRKKLTGKSLTYTLGFTNGAPPYTQFVFSGTRVMLPRSPLDVLREENSIKTINKVFKEALKQ